MSCLLQEQDEEGDDDDDEGDFDPKVSVNSSFFSPDLNTCASCCVVLVFDQKSKYNPGIVAAMWGR